MHDVAVLNATLSSVTGGEGGEPSVNVTLGNYGGSYENLTVSVYANNTLVASSNLTLKAQNLSTATLPLNSQAAR